MDFDGTSLWIAFVSALQSRVGVGWGRGGREEGHHKPIGASRGRKLKCKCPLRWRPFQSPLHLLWNSFRLAVDDNEVSSIDFLSNKPNRASYKPTGVPMGVPPDNLELQEQKETKAEEEKSPSPSFTFPVPKRAVPRPQGTGAGALGLSLRKQMT